MDKSKAEEVLRTQYSVAKSSAVDKLWERKFSNFSELCETSGVKTHIAFLATSLLAKSISKDVDLYAIKPKLSKKNSNAYSARSLCHGVLVPLAAELGIDLGVTGREPLNNQPYFRMNTLGDDTPIHQKGKAAFDLMLELVGEISNLKSTSSAQKALAAFIFVRLKYQKKYTSTDNTITITPASLCNCIIELVLKDSEGGKVAQAVVAGLADVFAGEGRVDSGRINDPSRHYPGDVCIRSSKNKTEIEKAFEVRDKPVRLSDVHIFGKKCASMNVREAAVVMVAALQEKIDPAIVTEWASNLGIGMTLFHGWSDFVEQVLFWSESSKPEAAIQAARQIEKRLKQVEASEKAVSHWQTLITKPDSI